MEIGAEGIKQIAGAGIGRAARDRFEEFRFDRVGSLAAGIGRCGEWQASERRFADREIGDPRNSETVRGYQRDGLVVKLFGLGGDFLDRTVCGDRRDYRDEWNRSRGSVGLTIYD